MASIDFEKYIASIPDYPKPGVVFKDITPLLADAAAFNAAIDAMSEPYIGKGVTKVVGSESRGFMFGAPIALRLDAGFVPARKPGKLPRETVSESYTLEYGTETLEMHRDALDADDKVLIVDDLIATGGTISAQIDLVKKLGGELVGIACLIELAFLNPRAELAKVTDVPLLSLVQVH
ncbi:MAG: adenine phosphoribosyltransferase [Eggerthellaceae bacterium]|jgi:adenine phosphoribosyltransferase